METIKQTILIIEDDAGLLELIGEKIESCGYQTALVQSAEKAIDWLKVYTAFLMILDYGLPDMNGKELIAELKAKEIFVPPFMVCTGQGDERIAVDMMKLGARDYIIKDSMFLEMLPLVVSRIAKVIENENKLKLTEQEAKRLAAALLRINKAVEGSGEAIGMSDPQGNHFYQNKAFTEIFEYTAEEIGAAGGGSVIYMNKEVGYKVFDTIIGGGSWNGEVEMLSKSGRKFTVLLRADAIKDENGIIIGLVGVHTDMTERKRAEEALRESETSLMESQRIAKMGSWDLDLQTQNIKWSENVFHFYGFNPIEVEPSLELFISTIHPEDANYFHEIFAKIISDKKPVSFECRVFIKDNFVRWIQNEVVPIINGDNLVKLKGVWFDITERKQAEQEINLKNEQLLKLNAEKDKFFSIIAHDLRGPFSGFLGLTEIMAEELPSLTTDQIQEYSVVMRNSAVNLYRLLENLLQWSRMQQGLIPFDPKVIQLRSIIDECIAIMLEAAKNKEIKITSDISDNLEVYADNNMLQTVIRNLVSNAVKFTPKGEKINVSAKSTGDKSVEISVIDSGIGMKAEMVGNLFRLDVKTNRLGTEGEPSCGLGLLLCKEFVEKHGGKIWVESTEGVGSTFYFTIPYSAEPENNIVPGELENCQFIE